MSAISSVGRTYAQNHKNLALYREAVAARGLAVLRGIRLTDDDLIRRDVIMRLLCDFSLDFAAVEARHGIRFADYFADSLEALAPLESDGLLIRTASGLEVTPAGRLLIRNVCTPFDAWLKERPNQRFSRTV